MRLSLLMSPDAGKRFFSTPFISRLRVAASLNPRECSTDYVWISLEDSQHLEIFRRFYDWIDMDRPMDSGRTKETKNLAERMVYGFLAGKDIQWVVQCGAERNHEMLTIVLTYSKQVQ